jgi:hypothetical protein
MIQITSISAQVTEALYEPVFNTGPHSWRQHFLPGPIHLEVINMIIRVGALLTLLLLLATASQAQQQPFLITNIEGRHTIDLNGRWQIIIDPYETG